MVDATREHAGPAEVDADLAPVRAMWFDETVANTLRGELPPCSGNRIDSDIELMCSILDTQGRVVDVSSCTFDAESCFGFETFQFYEADLSTGHLGTAHPEAMLAPLPRQT